MIFGFLLTLNNVIAMPLDPGNPQTYRTEEYRRQWGLETIKAADAYALLARNNKPIAGGRVLVGISDSGLLNHPDPEFTPNNTNIYFDNEKFPSASHGSFVTSIAVAARNDSNTHGVAFDAKFITAQAIRTIDDNIPIDSGPDYSSSWLNDNMHLLAESGAKVINMSWGLNEGTDQKIIEDISTTLKQDTLIAVAAGNSRTPFGAHTIDGITFHYIDPEKYQNIDQYRADNNIPRNEFIMFATNPDGKIDEMTHIIAADQNISHGQMIIVIRWGSLGILVISEVEDSHLGS